MELIYGPYGALAKRFVSEINGRKNPLEKTLVITASHNLKNILQSRLLEQASCAAALHFEDFLSLTVKINAQTKEGSLPLLPNTILQDFIIKNLLRGRKLRDERSYAAALKEAFRDLTSAEVSPEDLENLKDAPDLLSPDDIAALDALSSLYEEYLEAINIEGFIPYAKAMELAQNNAEESAYLKSFKRVIFYGIYDFTALQFNLLKKICENYETQIYFPYEQKTAYSFIKKFSEANLYPLAGKITEVKEDGEKTLSSFAEAVFNVGGQEGKTQADFSSLPLKIIETSGAQAELESAAKEILLLKESGIDFRDIALTARSMEPYKNIIQDVFEQNLIPLNASLTLPLTEEPLAAFIYNLFTVTKNNFYRDDVLAVLNSPYYKFTDKAYASAVKKTGVSSGLNQWFELLPSAQDKEAENKISSFLQNTDGALKELAQSAPFDVLAKKASAFIEQNLSEILTQREAEVLDEILQIIRDLTSLKTLGKAAREGEFLEEFLSSLKENLFPRVLPYESGVNCADIMTLRGKTFKAVIILGLNEGLLPAAVPPQAILKDKLRNVLFALGYLIRPSSDRYEEEKLLFYFALSSAERAILLYQRSDDEGKPKVPSIYLTRIKNILSPRLPQILSALPRNPCDLYAAWPFELLTKTQSFVSASLSGARPSALCGILQGGETETKPKTQDALEKFLGELKHLNEASSLTPYDGVLPPQNALWQKTEDRGISVSALNNLFSCPCKFLLENITNKDEEIKRERGALDAREKGNLYHEILEKFYKFLKEKNLLKDISPARAESLMKDFCSSFLNKEHNKTLGLYPLLWDMLRKEMESHLCAFIRSDVQRLLEDKCEPAFFEQPDASPVSLGKEPLKLKGKIDRIDVSSDGKSYRIIDYKTKEPSGSIETVLFTQKNLQPALYFELAKNLNALKDKTAEFMALEGIETDKKPKTFAYDAYLTLKPQIAKVTDLLLRIIKDGSFILYQNENSCRNCRFDGICRKYHAPSIRRSRISNLYKELKNARP